MTSAFTRVDRRRVGRGAARAEDAQETPTQSHISPSILVYEDYGFGSRDNVLRVYGLGSVQGQGEGLRVEGDLGSI